MVSGTGLKKRRPAYVTRRAWPLPLLGHNTREPIGHQNPCHGKRRKYIFGSLDNASVAVLYEGDIDNMGGPRSFHSTPGVRLKAGRFRTVHHIALSLPSISNFCLAAQFVPHSNRYPTLHFPLHLFPYITHWCRTSLRWTSSRSPFSCGLVCSFPRGQLRSTLMHFERFDIRIPSSNHLRQYILQANRRYERPV